jgi:outer membrane receptor protein involved in Fe transport
MVRNFLLTLSLLLVASLTFAQTSLTGKVSDKDTGEEMIAANIVVSKNGVFIRGETTDIDGNYKIRVDPGTYDMEISYTGYATQKITGVIASAGKLTRVDIQISSGELLDIGIEVIGYTIPLIDQEQTTSGVIVTSEQIRNLPTRNINAVAAATAGASSSDEGGAVTIKGSRSNATDYYIDGIRVSGNLLPESEIEQMQVITGGIGAKYGDVTGGIISITTKGPSAKFSGGMEAETSQYLDNFGHSLVGVNLSGPILKKTDENGNSTSILGFRFSGRYTHREDNRPTATGIYAARPEVLERLQANPILDGFGTPTGQRVLADEVDLLKTRPNESLEQFNGTLKLDARLSDAIDVSFTGTYFTGKDFFTPAGWTTFNSQNNPNDSYNRYRGNVRFRHRLGGSNGDAAKSSIVSNFEYIIQAGYEYNDFLRQDSRHEDRFFDYGYIGAVEKEYVPTIDFAFDGAGLNLTHGGFSENTIGYTLNREINPVLAAYNNGVTDFQTEDDLFAQNGQTFSNSNSIFEFHTNVGTVFNQYLKNQGTTITANISSSFDLHPGGTDKGRHSIEIGLLYEQREQRRYRLNPRRLWELADFNDNRHIIGVDTNMVVGMQTVDTQFGPVDVPIYQTLLQNDEGSLFYRSIREVTGDDLNTFVNVDELTPDQLDINMFAPIELTDLDLASFYGYDHTGAIIGSDVTFNDFFTSTQVTNLGNTVRDFPVAPFRPNYTAAYIQDKFTYKDIIFRLGLRVDRFDANTKVMKDPLSLYDIKDANQFYSEDDNLDLVRPLGVGDDYKVYVNGPDDNTVKAFRDGNEWFFADGSASNGGNVIFGTAPRYVQYSNPLANGNWIKDNSYDPNDGFEDYAPQINVMPRLAFSFPISDVANFFAHYDILVQRPPGDNIATALDYFYFGDAGRTPESNPNLKPERTIDYELGFQQKLSNSSAIKVSAYYKEMRDMIQIRDFLFLPSDLNITSYTGFDNLDFGTVKGFTFQYDLRRTKNVTLLAAYTLQFADGTGSDSESSRNLGSRGNIRNLFPLSFDERHRFNIAMDYRYESGRNYNGPVLFGKDILANAGANLQVIAVSGRPYTAKLVPASFGGDGTVGSLNGARLPWNFTVNIRVDKSFRIYTPQEAGKNPVNLNVYVRVQNLLDRRNLLGVYSASGSATDDGFLTSPIGQSVLQGVASDGLEQFYVPSYTWRMLNPGFFTLPRRIYVGASVNF